MDVATFKIIPIFRLVRVQWRLQLIDHHSHFPCRWDFCHRTWKVTVSVDSDKASLAPALDTGSSACTAHSAVTMWCHLLCYGAAQGSSNMPSPKLGLCSFQSQESFPCKVLGCIETKWTKIVEQAVGWHLNPWICFWAAAPGLDFYERNEW